MELYTVENQILVNEVTKIDSKLLPENFRGDFRSARLVQNSLEKIINWIGEQSSLAQGLKKTITTAEKMRLNTSHCLYLLKEAQANGGRSKVIGLLKVGRKHLFLVDQQQRTREFDPLCVLDFFVLPERQRHGHGQKLFDYMLQDLGVTASELAVDGPSPKMERFLAKNYGVERLMRQNNNFAVSPHFFEMYDTRAGRQEAAGAAGKGGERAVCGRFSAPQPHSTIANIIHGVKSPDLSGAFNGYAHVCRPRGTLEDSTERPTWMQVAPPAAGTSALEPPAAGPHAPANSGPSPAGLTSRRDSQLTEHGYFDVKFHHNKIW